MLMVRLHQAWVRPAASAIFTVFVVLFVWRNWEQMSRSVTVLRSVPLGDFWLAIPLVGLTFVLATFAYSFLAFRRLRFTELFVVELAAACVNRLVPSGLGGLGMHGLYLHKRRHSVAEATAVISSNNLLGMIIHLLLLGAVLATGSAGSFHLGSSRSQGWILLGISFALCTTLLIKRLRRAVMSFARNLLVSVRRYERQPHRLVYAALALCALTLINVIIIHLAVRSFGVWLDFPQLFLVYTGGVLIGAAVPTPGGLAGVEAGLVGGFMAYGVTATAAIAIALAFRLVTYWLPIVPGAIALYVSRRQRYI